MDLLTWAERTLTVSEEGATPWKISMRTTDGAAWQTWFPPFGTPEEWVADAERYLARCVEDWPATPIQLLFIAEDKQGTILSQCTRRTQGRNKGASEHVIGGQGKALAESMDAQAATMTKILAAANGQIELMSKALETSTAQNFAMLQLVQQLQLAASESKPTFSDETVEQAVKLLPDLLKMFVSNQKGS